MADNTATKSSALIRVQSVTSKLMTGHPTDGMNKVPAVKVFKPVLIQVVSVGSAVEVQSGRVLDPILVTSVL